MSGVGSYCLVGARPVTVRAELVEARVSNAPFDELRVNGEGLASARERAVAR